MECQKYGMFGTRGVGPDLRSIIDNNNALDCLLSASATLLLLSVSSRSVSVPTSREVAQTKLEMLRIDQFGASQDIKLLGQTKLETT